MKFNPFNVNGAKGNVVLNGSYNGSYWKPLSLKSKVKSTTIDMLDLLNQFNFGLDSTSFFNAVIDGDFDFRIDFGLPDDKLRMHILEKYLSHFSHKNMDFTPLIKDTKTTFQSQDIGRRSMQCYKWLRRCRRALPGVSSRWKTSQKGIPRFQYHRHHSMV